MFTGDHHLAKVMLSFVRCVQETEVRMVVIVNNVAGQTAQHYGRLHLLVS